MGDEIASSLNEITYLLGGDLARHQANEEGRSEFQRLVTLLNLFLEALTDSVHDSLPFRGQYLPF